MTRRTFFLLGVLTGLAIWLPAQEPIKRLATLQVTREAKLEEQEARAVLEGAEFAVIGAKYSIEDLFHGDREAVPILRNATAIRFRGIQAQNEERAATAQEVALLQDTLLSNNAYAPKCMCVLEKQAMLIVTAPEGSREFLLQYVGHPKMHSVKEGGISIGLSEAGLHVILKIHDRLFPEDNVWRFVKS